ncbi:MAG: metal ABC transporter substrate-binding protein [Candidatus Nezhaarchaeales archaeon]
MLSSLLLLCFLVFTLSQTFYTHAADVSDRPIVVVTISPLYLIAKEVVGDKAEIRVLAQAGVDPHHYSPTPEDLLLIESCNLFISVGKEEFLGTLPQPKGRVLSWSDWVGKGAFIRDNNPHYLWLHPDNAKVLAKRIAEVMSELDPLNSNYYYSQAREFEVKIEALKLWLQDIDDVVKRLEGKGFKGRKVVLVADHFEPLAEWLGLDVTCTIIRGEGLPGPRDISEAIERAKTSTLIIVSATQSEGDEGRIAQQVSEASGARMAYLYGIPMSTDDDYVSFIKRNIVIIASHFVELLPAAPSSRPPTMDAFVISTIALAAIAIVEAVLILRLRTQ